MRERYWIRLLPWKRKNKPDTKSAQIKFVPKLMITREEDWQYLELQLVNRSSWAVWVQEAAVVLIDPDAKRRATGSQGRARYEILQNVRPKDTLRVRLARTIYMAARRGRTSTIAFTAQVLFAGRSFTPTGTNSTAFGWGRWVSGRIGRAARRTPSPCRAIFTMRRAERAPISPHLLLLLLLLHPLRSSRRL